MTAREIWTTTDDRGAERQLVVDYDAHGVTEVTREAMHWLLTTAGLRRNIDAEDDR